MDLNLVVLVGRLSKKHELREFDSGARLLTLWLVLEAETPHKRTDVIPVSLWDPPDSLLEELDGLWELEQDERRVHVTAAVRRRFWEGPDGRRSRLEVIADEVSTRLPGDPSVSYPAPAGA